MAEGNEQVGVQKLILTKKRRTCCDSRKTQGSLQGRKTKKRRVSSW